MIFVGESGKWKGVAGKMPVCPRPWSKMPRTHDRCDEQQVGGQGDTDNHGIETHPSIHPAKYLMK